VEPLIASGAASGGMAPKLRAAVQALRGGVGAVRIGDLATLHDADAGTRIRSTGRTSAAA
jgi:acetylglutamate kinase